jgi:hypothetical protein
LRKSERCVDCGYRYGREEGFELGAVTMNTVVTFGCLAVFLVVGLVSTSPDVPVLKLIVIGETIALLLPVFFYPISYTLWAAVDLSMVPLRAGEAEDAARWIAQRQATDSETETVET